MRPYLGSLALSFGLATTACGTAGSDEEAAAATAAAETVTPDTLCLYPSTHPFNGVSQVFTVDLTPTTPTTPTDPSAPSERLVTRSSGFYWHGVLITLSQPLETWSVSDDNEVDGMHVQAGSVGSTSVLVDLTARTPQGQFDDRTGSVHVRPEFGDNAEIVPIVRVQPCPVRQAPSTGNGDAP